MAKRKRIGIYLIVSVPAHFSAADARLEVRTLVNEARNYYADEGDVKAIAVKPAGRLK